MHFVTPSAIEHVAWQGELVAPAVTLSGKGPRSIVVTIGQPEVWPAAEALETVVGQKWTPPLGDADFWLLRLACTLREPPGRPTLTEAQQRLHLRPRNRRADRRTAYAFSLFPDRLSVEDKGEVSAQLGPELKFASGAGVSVGEIGATLQLRQVFPVIQSYGAGEPEAGWLFRAHEAYPLDGSQFAYAVLAARAGAGGIRASVELVATVQTQIGPLRLGLPEEAHAHLSFDVP